MPIGCDPCTSKRPSASFPSSSLPPTSLPSTVNNNCEHRGTISSTLHIARHSVDAVLVSMTDGVYISRIFRRIGSNETEFPPIDNGENAQRTIIRHPSALVGCSVSAFDSTSWCSIEVLRASGKPTKIHLPGVFVKPNGYVNLIFSHGMSAFLQHPNQGYGSLRYGEARGTFYSRLGR